MQDLLLLHGALGSKDQFKGLAELLKDKYRVHTMNFSGHGGKPFCSFEISIPQFANEVLEYSEQNNIEQINIFGYSMGGYVALLLAKQHPDLIQKIITLATKFYWDETVAAKEATMLDPETIEQKVPAFAQQLKERHQPIDWKSLLTKTKDMLIRLGKNNTLQLKDYEQIPHDCLLLLGEKDKMVTKEETIDVANSLPHGLFKSLPDTPHPLEQVDDSNLALIIKNFIG